MLTGALGGLVWQSVQASCGARQRRIPLDHLDAMVWAVHELFLKEGFTDYSMFDRPVDVFMGMWLPFRSS